jgi:hypothetical protein
VAEKSHAEKLRDAGDGEIGMACTKQHPRLPARAEVAADQTGDVVLKVGGRGPRLLGSGC